MDVPTEQVVEKVCSKCGVKKPVESGFMKLAGPRGYGLFPSAYRSWCTGCCVIYNRVRRHNNPEVRQKANDRTKNWARMYPDKAKSSWLKKRFGITLDQRNQMLAEQGNKCANKRCLVNHPGYYNSTGRFGKPKDWHVDHDHSTGQIRGIVCANCNMALGMAQDDVERLRGLIEYLQKHENQSPVLTGLSKENEVVRIQ